MKIVENVAMFKIFTRYEYYCEKYRKNGEKIKKSVKNLVKKLSFIKFSQIFIFFLPFSHFFKFYEN